MTNGLEKAKKLTKAQADVLLWLSQAETSVYGECRGDDLDALVALGFAAVEERGNKHRWGTRPGPDYDRVSITPLGRQSIDTGGGEG